MIPSRTAITPEERQQVLSERWDSTVSARVSNADAGNQLARPSQSA